MTIKYEDSISVRISDINYGGHLGHAELLNLLHEIRVKFLNTLGYSEIDIIGHALVTKELDIKYINQAYWHDVLRVVMTIEIDQAKVIFGYDVYNETQKNHTADAKLKMVFINKENLKIARPDFFMEILGKVNV